MRFKPHPLSPCTHDTRHKLYTLPPPSIPRAQPYAKMLPTLPLALHKRAHVHTPTHSSLTPHSPHSIKLKAFNQFKDTVEAVAAASAMVEGSLGKSLKKFLTKQIVKKEAMKNETLIVQDKSLAGIIKDKMDLQCTAPSR